MQYKYKIKQRKSLYFKLLSCQIKGKTIRCFLIISGYTKRFKYKDIQKAQKRHIESSKKDILKDILRYSLSIIFELSVCVYKALHLSFFSSQYVRQELLVYFKNRLFKVYRHGDFRLLNSKKHIKINVYYFSNFYQAFFFLKKKVVHHSYTPT